MVRHCSDQPDKHLQSQSQPRFASRSTVVRNHLAASVRVQAVESHYYSYLLDMWGVCGISQLAIYHDVQVACSSLTPLRALALWCLLSS